MQNDYKTINKALWNAKTDIHISSEFYNNEQFLAGKSSLNDIEIDLLGDVKGLKILHLQCHFGQDTISLTRMGANCVGIDISDKAIDYANKTAKELNIDAAFIACDLYDAPNYCNEKFDIVYTSYGTIGWLPDINKWAEVITNFLKPGGKLVFVEFHPVVWMFDENFENIPYRYFQDEAIVEVEEGTYAEKGADIKQKSISWNHGLAEVMTSLIDKGLHIDNFQEFDYSPYNCFNGCVEYEKGKFRIDKLGNKIPMIYSIVAMKQ